MSVYRSYFSKNDTLIEDNESNNSQNPVTEISYGTVNSEVSRFIFEIDLEPLKKRIKQGIINPDRILKHVLYMTNTINTSEKYLGTKMHDGETQRTSSFDLELWNLEEEWDEGSGYDFVYDEEQYIKSTVTVGPVNWYDTQTGIEWETEGAYSSGSTILGEQHFEKGNENIEIDLTDYINFRLGLISGTTGLTGSTGVGIKFFDYYEAQETLHRQAVAFYARKTNTAFEPHIRTVFDDTIKDDRNYFFLDKNNELYLYYNKGGQPSDVTVNSVEIIDYMGQPYTTISGDSVEKIRLGVHKITLNIDSDVYPDAVLFTDRWNYSLNGKNKSFENEFYLLSDDGYFNFDLGNRINFDNYTFSFFGLSEGEKIKDNEIRRIEVDVKQLYPNQDNNVPLDVEYRLYNSQTDHHQFDIIPWTKVNRTFRGYDFFLDFSWLVPQDYKLELRLLNGNTFQVKDPINFTVVSAGITTPAIEEFEPITTTTSTTTTTTTLPPTTTTTTTSTTTSTTTTTTTTIPPNPKIFMSLQQPDEPGTYTNDLTPLGPGQPLELMWSTDSSSNQKFNEAIGGTPLYTDVTVRFNWISSGASYFEVYGTTGVTGMPLGTISNATFDVVLKTGDNRGYVRFDVQNSGVTLTGYEVNANNIPDPTVEFGLISDSTDVRYVLKEDMPLIGPTPYGYIEFDVSGTRMINAVST